jgi:pre-mRNA-processing factor SLU7
MEPKGFIEDWYNRSERGNQSTSYRKGACENCGAMGHSRKDCTERPRKLAARFTSKNIASDDVVRDIRMNWEIKRDRWNGYTPEMYGEVIEDYRKYEEARKKVKGDDVDDTVRATDNPLLTATLPSGLKKEKFQGLGGVRNREDRAKYLLNLDLNSASFDPKSRTLAGEDAYLKELSNL